jgi:tRNA uracil 4-sulfurtransferase
MTKPKLLCLISGGIDSPVAAHMMLAKGYNVEFVNFDLTPVGNDYTKVKIEKLVKHLGKIHKKKLKLTFLDHGKHLVKYYQKLDEKERKQICLLCRRRMLIEGEKFAKKINAKALLTGENLGQVASQTLDNMYVEDKAVSIPILRPLIGFNKQDIINISRKIGTYDISIEPGGCCNITPNRPEVHASIDIINAIDKKLAK